MRSGVLSCIVLGLGTAVVASISACGETEPFGCMFDGDASAGIQGRLLADWEFAPPGGFPPELAAGEEVEINVELWGETGGAICSAAISWTPSVNSGSVDPNSSVTDEHGSAKATWTLGPTPGTQTVTATVDAADPPLSVTFTATVPEGLGSHPRAQISAYNGTLTPGVTVTMQTPFDGQQTFGPLAANTMQSDSLHVEVGVAFQITAVVGTQSGSITCTTLPTIMANSSDPVNTGNALVAVFTDGGVSLSCNGAWAAAAPSKPSPRRAGGP